MIRTRSFDGPTSLRSKHGPWLEPTTVPGVFPFRVLISVLIPILAGAAISGARTLNGFDLSSASIPAKEILAGGPPRDGIPGLDAPRFESAADAKWSDGERVLGITVGGESRAYPVAILDWHELVNDTLGGQPILVSYCPLCRTGMVFDRRVGGKVRRFGVSGLLFRSDVLMFDRESESLWSQIKAEAVTGPLRGKRLTLLRSSMDDWGSWRRAHPESTILSRSTGHARNYDRSPYAGYATSRELHFPAPHDRRYHPKTLTLGIRIANHGARAYPAPEVENAGGSVAEDFAGRRIVVSYDARRAVFEVAAPEDVEIIEGYWFAWAAFHPDTTVFEAVRP